MTIFWIFLNQELLKPMLTLALHSSTLSLLRVHWEKFAYAGVFQKREKSSETLGIHRNTLSPTHLLSIGRGILELSDHHLQDVWERDVLELLHSGQDEVVLDGDEVVVTQQHYPLLLQVPVIHSEGREGRRDMIEGERHKGEERGESEKEKREKTRRKEEMGDRNIWQREEEGRKIKCTRILIGNCLLFTIITEVHEGRNTMILKIEVANNIYQV